MHSLVSPPALFELSTVSDPKLLFKLANEPPSGSMLASPACVFFLLLGELMFSDAAHSRLFLFFIFRCE